MSERDIKHTPEGLLQWSLEHSDPKAQANVDKSKLMTHEEFQELWKTAFPDEVKILKENLAIIRERPSDLPKMHEALDRVLFIVEGIDQADWFADLEGFELVLPLLKDDNEETRMAAAWIISNALQNNPKVQDKFMNKVGVKQLLDSLDGEEVENAAKKKFGMVTSIIRGYKPGRTSFYQNNGMKKLIEVAEKYPSLMLRIVWLVGAILDEEDPSDKAEFQKENLKSYILTNKAKFGDDEMVDSVVSRL